MMSIKSINNIEEENEDEINLYEVTKKYLEEEQTLLKKKKISLVKDLKNLVNELDAEKEIKAKGSRLNEEKIEEKDSMIYEKGKKYEDLNDFIVENADNIINISEKINTDFNSIYCWINIKIIGTIFMTLYFIGILEIIGLLNSVGKEIKCSLELILFEKKRENDFYQNYINENLKAPSFDLFFLSAIFSGALIKTFTFPGTVTLLFFIITGISIGIDNFNFHSDEVLNERYSAKENIILILIYIGIYLAIGIIALFPHEIIQKGYLLYDIQCEEKLPEKNGYIFAYLFSMVISSIIKMLVDRKYVFDEIKLISEDKKNIFFFNYIFIIIAIFLASMIISFIFYFIYECIFTKVKNDKDISHQAIKICGYFIYCETEKRCCCCDCVDCQMLCKKCSRCFGFYLCECCCCCYCCCNDHEEADDGQKQLCIIYKLKGIWSSVGDLLAGNGTFLFVIIIYTFELINIGFNPELSEYLDSKKEEEKEILIINIISFVSRLLIYFLNLAYGLLHIVLFKKYKEIFEKEFDVKIKKTEANLISNSLAIFSFFFIILNTVLSGMFYFHEKNKYMYYCIPISISISEYANIILLYVTQGTELSVDVMKKSFAISFYKLILTVVKFFIGMFKFDNKYLVFFQFIFGSSILGVCILFLLICVLPQKCIKNN